MKYKTVGTELEIVGEIVMRNGLVIIPPGLRAKAMKIAHKGHLGVTKTQSFLRECVWWPKMGLT